MRACSVCCLYVDNASVTETHGGRRRRNWRRALGIQLDSDCAVYGNVSGTPPVVSHREGILLDVTMNRKPSPPPEPTQAFDVRGSHRALAAQGAHSYPERLATSPCHARPGQARPIVGSAQPEAGKKKAERRKFRLHGQQTITVNAHLSLKYIN